MRILGLGPAELMIVGLIALAIFGRRLPDVTQSLGRGMESFRHGMHIRRITPRQWRRYLLELQISEEEGDVAAREFVRRVAPWLVGLIVLYLACFFLFDEFIHP